MSVTRYYGQPLPITAKADGNPFTIYNKDYSDIEDVSMNLKKDLANDADDKYLERTQLGGGVTLDQANNRFTMAMDDYGTTVKGVTYHLVVAVKLAGFTEWIELKLSDDIVNITKDKNRA